MMQYMNRTLKKHCILHTLLQMLYITELYQTLHLMFLQCPTKNHSQEEIDRGMLKRYH
jgi:hypothetical protein